MVLEIRMTLSPISKPSHSCTVHKLCVILYSILYTKKITVSCVSLNVLILLEYTHKQNMFICSSILFQLQRLQIYTFYNQYQFFGLYCTLPNSRNLIYTQRLGLYFLLQGKRLASIYSLYCFQKPPPDGDGHAQCGYEPRCGATCDGVTWLMECGGYRFEAGLPQLPQDAADGNIDAEIERYIYGLVSKCKPVLLSSMLIMHGIYEPLRYSPRSL